MSEPKSDALAFFGATGDLAYKKIFPSLQAMLKRGHLDVPVIGVAKAGWTLEQLRARARDSLREHGGVPDTQALNIGYAPVAKRGVPALEPDRPAHVSGTYLPAETFSLANAPLIGAQYILKAKKAT